MNSDTFRNVSSTSHIQHHGHINGPRYRDQLRRLRQRRDLALARCSDGVDTNGVPTTTKYCGKDCQAAHGKEHKGECKASNDRKVLYRAGEVLQRAFDLYRRRMFEDIIEKVDVEADGVLQVYCGQRHLDGFSPEDRFVGVAEDTFLSGMQVKAIVAYGASKDAIARMAVLLDKMLPHLIPSVVELAFTPTRARAVVFHDHSASAKPADATHYVYRLTLHDTTYALDLCSAEYGLTRTITPWSTYAHTMLASPSSTYGFRHHLASEYHANVAQEAHPSLDYDIRAVRFGYVTYCFSDIYD